MRFALEGELGYATRRPRKRNVMGSLAQLSANLKLGISLLYVACFA